MTRNNSDIIQLKDDIRQVMNPEDLVVNDHDTHICNCKVIRVVMLNSYKSSNRCQSTTKPLNEVQRSHMLIA